MLSAMQIAEHENPIIVIAVIIRFFIGCPFPVRISERFMRSFELLFDVIAIECSAH
jgi:hypothetical protein